jgi:hypothetical protein
MTQQSENLSWAVERLRREEKTWRVARIGLLLCCSVVVGLFVFGDLSTGEIDKLMRSLMPAFAWGMICWVISRWKGNPTTAVLLKLIEVERAKCQGV